MKINEPIQEQKDVPKNKHYAVIVFETRTIHHEGDERSRTHPGHGYPAHTETIKTCSYIPFDNEDQMRQWVIDAEMKTYDKPSYQLISVTPLWGEIEVKSKIGEYAK